MGQRGRDTALDCARLQCLRGDKLREYSYEAFRRPLTELKESDLIALKEGGQAERKTLDYKRDVVGPSDSDKREFLYDVSSFANSAGGFLIFGVTEKDGVPIDLVGLAVDPDKEILRLQQMLRAGVRPTLAAVEIAPVKLGNGRHAIVIHIPKSWNPPHQVVFQGAFRFCARDSRGKYFVEVDELRTIFAVSGTIAERIRTLRVERTTRIAAGDAPVTLLGQGYLALHVVPFSAFSAGYSFPLDEVMRQPNAFPPILDNYSRQYLMTFDGFLAASNSEAIPKPQRAYTQISRTGIVEAVAASITRGSPSNFIMLPSVEAMIVASANRYMSRLQLFGVEPPIAILASLINVQDMRFIREFYNNALLEDMPSERLVRDQYHFVETIFETIPNDYRVAAKRMRGTLDHLANAAGCGASPNFDAAGNYTMNISGA